jgi:hypothetical protein
MTKRETAVEDSPNLLQPSDIIRRQDFCPDESHLLHEIFHVGGGATHAGHGVGKFGKVDAVHSSEDEGELAADGGEEEGGLAGVEGQD